MKYLVYESRISITAALFWSNHTIREQCCGLYNLLQPVLRWGLQSLSTWKCDHLQMLLQRQHYFTSHFKFTGLVPRIWPPRERISWQGIVDSPSPQTPCRCPNPADNFSGESWGDWGREAYIQLRVKHFFFFSFTYLQSCEERTLPFSLVTCGEWMWQKMCPEIWFQIII